MGKAFSAGVSWAQQLYKQRIPQNVPGTVLFLPSIATEVEWTVWPSKSIFYQLFTLRHLNSFLFPTVQPPAPQYHSIRAAEQTQAWHIKSNPNQSQFTLICQTIIWDDSICSCKQWRLEQREASHSDMFLKDWAMLAGFALLFCLSSVLHMVRRENNLPSASSSGRPRQQQHLSMPQISCSEL